MIKFYFRQHMHLPVSVSKDKNTQTDTFKNNQSIFKQTDLVNQVRLKNVIPNIPKDKSKRPSSINIRTYHHSPINNHYMNLPSRNPFKQHKSVRLSVRPFTSESPRKTTVVIQKRQINPEQTKGQMKGEIKYLTDIYQNEIEEEKKRNMGDDYDEKMRGAKPSGKALRVSQYRMNYTQQLFNKNVKKKQKSLKHHSRSFQTHAKKSNLKNIQNPYITPLKAQQHQLNQQISKQSNENPHLQKMSLVCGRFITPKKQTPKKQPFRKTSHHKVPTKLRIQDSWKIQSWQANSQMSNSKFMDFSLYKHDF